MANSYNLTQRRLTRQSIVEALVSLLQTKSFEHISVSELCLRAGVSRMAFYRHFENLQDVLKGHFRDQRHEFLGWLRSEPEADLYSIGLRFLQVIERERTLFRALVRVNLQWILADYLVTGMERFRSEFRPLEYSSPLEKEYLIAYEAGGFLSIISKWVGRDCRDPKEEVLRYVVDHSPFPSR